jgi:hypothetical protein
MVGRCQDDLARAGYEVVEVERRRLRQPRSLCCATTTTSSSSVAKPAGQPGG